MLGLEELIVDRLAGWQFWQSETDGYNVWLLWSSGEQRIDLNRLRTLAARNETTAALESLIEFARRHQARKPTHSEIEEWARKPP